MNLREAAFWGLDWALGRRIRTELRDVELLNNRSEEATKRRLELLEEHLDFVTSKVPYYKNLHTTSTLSDFPVLNKEFIRANQQSLVADEFDTSNLHIASTSGSTGTPFRVYQNREKRVRIDAESIYFGRLAGYRIGNHLWHLKVWTRRNSNSRFSRLARNIHPVDVSSFGEHEAQLLLEKIIKLRRTSSIIAYSSSLETIARMLSNRSEALSSQLQLASVVGQSEPLSQEAREIFAKAIGIYPVARYGLEELGVLGQQQASKDGSYRLNHASHIVEVLQLNNDSNAAPGDVGRIVVTDLFNRAQPMVRYDTGDLAIVGTTETGTGFADSLARLDGRSRERLYDVNDRPLTPMIAYNFWWKFPALLQYQIVQTDRGQYTLRLHVDKAFNQETELVEELRTHVGGSAQIDVEYDNTNYQHTSGKRQVIVCKYIPSNMTTR